MNNSYRFYIPLILLLLSMRVLASNLPDYLLEQAINLSDGDTVTLADYQDDKPVYLKFWASWCQPCLEQMPHFQKVQKQYGNEIVVISINIDMNDNQQAVQTMIKQFGLTMPMAIDESGDLAQAFHLLGTPYHLLFDRHSNLVHHGHEANKLLDNKLALVAEAQDINMFDAGSLLEGGAELLLPVEDGRAHGLFFTATWCDWYLAESRSQVARHCAAAQEKMNDVVKQHPDIIWHGIISRLWTSEKDVAEYRDKFSIDHDLHIDQRNEWFYRYGVKKFPTLVLVENGKEIYRVEGDFDINQLPID